MHDAAAAADRDVRGDAGGDLRVREAHFHADGGQYSWWDYRAAMFRRNLGLRIDHILLSPPVLARASTCVIDRAPRKNERPSDHTPVVVTLA